MPPAAVSYKLPKPSSCNTTLPPLFIIFKDGLSISKFISFSKSLSPNNC